MEIERFVPRSRIVRDLAALGIQRGDTVMVHEAVSQIGWIVGGPEVVLDALEESVGPEGTILKYVGSEDGLYDVASYPPEAREAYERECPAFDPLRTRGTRQFGLLAEYIRSRAGSHRSSHPDSSFAAFGRRADWITADHPLQNGLGPGSPLDKLVQAGGKVALLGSPLDTTTLLHLAEYLADVPNKRRVHYRAAILREGQRVLVDVSELDSSNGIARWSGGDDYFAAIVSAFLAEGRGRSGRVGYASSHLLPAGELVTFGARWMEQNLG